MHDGSLWQPSAGGGTCIRIAVSIQPIGDTINRYGGAKVPSASKALAATYSFV